MTDIQNDLINGVFRVLGDLPDAPRPNMLLAHSLVTGELVAIALPAKSGRGATAAELRLEGEIFGDIAHPNIHRIVDWSADETFVAWEYQPMWPLTAVLARGRQEPVSAVLRMLTDIGMGLAALHARGAVYRGLHPGRIFISRDGTAKLATCPDVVNTGRGRAVGIGPSPETPIRYLPPEQIDGSFDGRADLYTAAALAYELLTGQCLYGDTDPVTLAVQILKTSPEPPSHFRSDLTAELDDFMLHSLARDPAERPTTATSFIALIRKVSEMFEPDSPGLVAASVIETPVTYAMSHRAPTQFVESGPAAAVAGGFASVGASFNGNGHGGDTEHPSDGETPVNVAPASPSIASANGHANGHANGKSALPSNGNGARTNGAHTNGNGAHTKAAKPVEAGSIPAAFAIALLTPSGQALPVQVPRLVIGRGLTVTSAGGLDLTQFDTSRAVSRNHAELQHTDSGWICRDLGATNGTYVNGTRLESGAEIAVAPGDRLSFANVALTVEGVAAWAT